MYGKTIKLSIFGESHGPAIGMVLDAPPAGYPIDFNKIDIQMARRAPGQDKTATPRKESDIPEFLSGLLDGTTTGAPLAAIIRNTNTRSGDYDNLKTVPRPSHADYAASVRYGGNNDVAGGGHFSGRLTAPLTVAGSIAKQIMESVGVEIIGHVLKIGAAEDKKFEKTELEDIQKENLKNKYFSVINNEAKLKMEKEIEDTQKNGDSIGGTVEIAVCGLPVGIGSPMFDGVENRISSALFAVPAIKGIEFGAGFSFAKMRGSEANDQLYTDGEHIYTSSNNCGGITGGITNGMPLIIRAAFKPTPSISIEQNSVNLSTMKNEKLSIKGRHDPCIVPRGLVAAESAVAVALLDMLKEGGII